MAGLDLETLYSRREQFPPCRRRGQALEGEKCKRRGEECEVEGVSEDERERGMEMGKRNGRA